MNFTIRHLPDEHYVVTNFGADTLQFIYKSLSFYRDLLGTDLAALQGEKDLADSLAADGMRSSKLQQEQKLISRMVQWHDMKRQEQDGVSDYDIGLISMESMGIYKSACTLYLAHLQQQRNRLAGRANLSKYTLEDVDAHLARLREKLNRREFANVPATPLLVDELAAPEQDALPDQMSAPVSITAAQQPRARLLESIEILDPLLRERCLDLFAKFQEAAQHDRFDTVITEASRILEDRMRSILKETGGATAVKLAVTAFGTDSPKLVLSAVAAEQESVMLFFKGLFGYVRNPPSHKLIGPVSPERTLQILGMIDYAIYLEPIR